MRGRVGHCREYFEARWLERANGLFFFAARGSRFTRHLLVGVSAAIRLSPAILKASPSSTRVRYSGASLGSLSSVVAGGLSPFIATALLLYGRGALAAYIIGMAIVTIVSVLIASETREREMG